MKTGADYIGGVALPMLDETHPAAELLEGLVGLVLVASE